MSPSLHQRLSYEFGCIARWRIFSSLQLLWFVFNKLLLINECNSNFCIPAYVSIENLHAHWLICYDIDIWNNWTTSTHMRCSLNSLNSSFHYIEYFSDFLSTHFYLYSSFFTNYPIVIFYVFCITVESHLTFDLYRVDRLQLYDIKWIWLDWKFLVTPYLLQIKYFNHKIKLGIRETIIDSSFFFILKILHINTFRRYFDWTRYILLIRINILVMFFIDKQQRFVWILPNIFSENDSIRQRP